ncbi:MAG TPA: phosphate/phosphite/phosphonate ABC transporter substrate-binding protein [Oscillatoriaceae cyanobacterium]
MLTHATIAVAALQAGVLHYALAPSANPAQQMQVQQPVIRYLEQQLGMRVELDIPKDNKELIDGCLSGKYDVAHFGGYAYVQIHEQAGWLPLVQGKLAHAMHTVFITQSDSDIKTLDDLNGKSFGFGDRNSASDYLMPTYFLDLNDLPARAIFKRIDYTKHPVEDVANYKLDAAAVEQVSFQHTIKSGVVPENSVRVFYTTPPFPDNLWATRANLAPDLRTRLTNAFLRLDENNPADKKILDILRAPSFTVPRNEDYAKVRDAELLEGLLITHHEQ